MTLKTALRVFVPFAFFAALVFISCGDDETAPTISSALPSTEVSSSAAPTTEPATTAPATTAPATTEATTTGAGGDSDHHKDAGPGADGRVAGF